MFHVKHSTGDVLLGVDVGTSGLKALLIDSRGALLGSATETYPLKVPRPGWAEQDPEAWWGGCTRAIKRLLNRAHLAPSRVAGVGITGQMHGSVFLDPAGKVLMPALLWCDQRTQRECAEITSRVGGAKSLLRLTMNPALTGFTAPKVMWVRRHAPEVFRKTAKLLLPKDFVNHRLTGGFSADVSDASGTLLFDVARRRWSGEVLKALRIPREWLPDALESCQIAGKVSRAAASATGLLEGTPVVAGAGDQAAGAVGCGVVEPGIVSCTLGTSGVVFAACNLPRHAPDGSLHLFCSAVKGGWHMMGVMLSAGGSFKWLRDEMACLGMKIPPGADPYTVMSREAEKVPAGSEGLVFLPYLSGERTPHADPHARGVFYGLSLRHGPAHLVRAVLEGVAYGMRDSLEIMRGLGLHTNRIRLSGGGAKGPLWCRIQASVYGRKGYTLVREEGPAMGAAMLAGIGTGLFRDYSHACRVGVQEKAGFAPVAGWLDEYRKGYKIYRGLYPALRPLFAGEAAAESGGRKK
jgi:xylulokinase